MMSPTVLSPPPNRHNNNPSNENDTTPLMQRNYLQPNNNSSKPTNNNQFHNHPQNITASRRRDNHTPFSDGVSQLTMPNSAPFKQQQQQQSNPHNNNNSTFHQDKEHGRNTNIGVRIMGCLSQPSLKYCCTPCTSSSSSLSIPDTDTHYSDTFNDESWSCRAGTSAEDGIWMNFNDQAGIILAFLVWLLLGYSAVTITFLAQTGGIPRFWQMLYCVLSALALACHGKTSLTDPGTVPQSAVPVGMGRGGRMMEEGHAMCSQCQTFKPPFSHHCRICNRCVSRMDHHCPWMNNCVGAGNLKHFLLFLLYTWTCSSLALCLLGWNYFLCEDETCMFTPVLIELVRVMTVLCVGSFMFTSSMLMNVCYGLMTGIGTIDRLKKKANNTMNDSDEEPILLKDVFGIQGYWTWFLPMDPVFEDFDHVMGYSTPQRLLREQLKENPIDAQDQYASSNAGASCFLPV